MSDDGGRRNGASGADAARRHGRDLEAVNAKLRELIESLRAERERRLRAEPGAEPASPPPGGGTAAPPARPEAELALAHGALAEGRVEGERLRARLAEIEGEHRRLCDDFVAVEEQNSELAALYAALVRLHGTLDRSEVLDAIQEIVVNIVGSEELAVYELAPDGKELVLARSCGVDGSRRGRIRVGGGTVGRVAATGRAFLAGRGESPDDPDLTACIPLALGGRVTGAVAIYRLLGQKPLLSDADGRIFELLGTHAASALYLTGLHERTRAGAR